MKDDRLYLHHILERCRRIERFIQPGREAFIASEVMQDAVVRNIEVIGEAAKRVSPAMRGQLPALNWNAICGMTWMKSGTSLRQVFRSCSRQSKISSPNHPPPSPDDSQRRLARHATSA